MTIDWSKAPEYATHWCPKINMFHTDAALCEECIPRPQGSNAADQGKRILVETFVAGPGRDRIVMGDSERVMRHGDKVEIYLTRSQKPEVEWDGKGLPPVGREFEIDVKTAIDWHAGDAWRRCEILAHRGGKAICWVPTCNTVMSTSNAEHFRPVRTQEQRQKDELSEFIGSLLKGAGWEPEPNDGEDIADAILSRYNLEPKDV